MLTVNSQSTAEVATCLEDHGCKKITADLDLVSCSSDPVVFGGFADVYRGKLVDGSQVAVKTMRLPRIADEARGSLKVSSFVV